MPPASPDAPPPAPAPSWLSAYAGRVRATLDVCGPPSWASLLASDAEIAAAHAALRPGAPALPPREAARARYLSRAAVHPDTGEIIALPFRMAAHVPANAILLVGMLSARSVAGTALWQLLNQSFNAAQFYANRNASASGGGGGVGGGGEAALAAAFAGAVAGSVGVGVALRRAALRAEAAAATPAAARRAALLSLATPFLAAAAAKPIQIPIMRIDEWAGRGVEVFDARGTPQGRSVVAGAAAVAATVLTRIVYLAPMLWMPPLQAMLERRMPLLRASRGASIAAFTLHAAATSAFVTPLCIALFDQKASLPASALEARFAHLGDQLVTYNKGL
jgi:hypothetical protein